MALADNDGPTATMAPAVTSPAIDVAIAGCGTPATDQRGYWRVAGAAADLGAVELNAFASNRLFASGFESLVVDCP